MVLKMMSKINVVALDCRSRWFLSISRSQGMTKAILDVVKTVSQMIGVLQQSQGTAGSA
jgi:hypothetical protein